MERKFKPIKNGRIQRVYNSVKIPQTRFKEGPLGIEPAKSGTNAEGPKGIFYGNEAITQVVPFINVVDIDWNGVEVDNGNVELNTTSDFLDWIENLQKYSEQITYENLKTSQFKPGNVYCIENYICTSSLENTQCDTTTLKIFVQALSSSLLNENAYAYDNDGNIYHIKYSLNNDDIRFNWADTTNGKGVIYWMKDQFGNECPYDFKHIKFKGTNDNYYYTFDSSGNDISVNSLCNNNIIYPCYQGGKQILNFIIITKASNLSDPTIESKLSDIIIKSSCHHITLTASEHVLIQGGNYNVKLLGTYHQTLIAPETFTTENQQSFSSLKSQSYWSVIGKQSDFDIVEKNLLDDAASINNESIEYIINNNYGILNCDNAFIKNLQSENIVTDYLTVNKSAHFFELIIDQMNSVSGVQINTAANCTAELVELYDSDNHIVDITSPNHPTPSYYRVYWRNSDGNKKITNNWKKFDQALCQTFNVGDNGNKYYWRLVVKTNNDTGENTRYINFNTNSVITAAQTFAIEFDSSMASVVFNSQVPEHWDSSHLKWSPEHLSETLELTNLSIVSRQIQIVTNAVTKLNIEIQYTDQSNRIIYAEDYTSVYTITLEEGKELSKVIISSAVIEKWEECNWIDLSYGIVDRDPNNSSTPEVGDALCQLGYRYNRLVDPTQDDIARASAIIIAAYKTPDGTLQPPSYAQYQNIIDFDLPSHRKTYFDANGAKFVGKFEIQTDGGDTSMEEYINSLRSDNPFEIRLTNTDGSIINTILLRTDSEHQIQDLNNFPAQFNVQVINKETGIPYMLGLDDEVDLTLNTVTYYLHDEHVGYDYNDIHGTPPVGIYIDGLTLTDNDTFNISCAFNSPGNQLINNSSIQVHAKILLNDSSSTDDDSGDENTFQNVYLTIPILGVESADAELWRLRKNREIACVRRRNLIHSNISSSELYVNLSYSIEHIFGGTSTILSDAENKALSIQIYDNTFGHIGNVILQAEDYIDSCWIYENTVTNWINLQNKPTYFVIKLMEDDTVLYSTILTVTLEPASFFTVVDGLTSSIQSSNNSISEIEQTANKIKLSVDNINQWMNGEFPQDIPGEQKFIFLRTNSNNLELSWDGDLDENEFDNDDVNDRWTTYRVEPTEDYQYVWCSNCVYIEDYAEWTEWSYPVLLKAYGVPGGFVNGASLEVQAGRIASNVYRANEMGYITSSEISQTANHIRAAVTDTIEGDLRSTGIDITTGEIILDANKTTINGNLSIHNANEGLIVYDHETDKPAITILGETLGNFLEDNTLNQDINTLTLKQDITNIQKDTSGNLTFDLNFGTIYQDQTLLIRDIYFWIGQGSSSEISWTAYLKKDGVSIWSRTGTLHNVLAEDPQFSIPMRPYLGATSVDEGIYTCTVNVSLNSINFDITKVHGYARIVKTIETVQKIAKDGALFLTNGMNYSWFGPDITMLRRDKSFIKLDETGAQISGLKVLNNPNSNGNFYPTLDHGIITTNGSAIYLPTASSSVGKVYFIKNTGSSTYIYHDGTNDTLTNKPMITWCDGSGWYILSGS